MTPIKIKNIRFSAPVIHWLTSYQSSRTAVPSINSITSTPKLVTLGVLLSVKEFLDLGTRCVLYTSLILPLFDYGDIICGEKNNSILMNSLQVLENKAAKIILGQQRYFLNQSFRRTKMDNAANGRHNHRCTFIFNCTDGLIYFNFELAKNEDIHEHNTRHCRFIHLPRAKTNKGKQRPTY